MAASDIFLRVSSDFDLPFWFEANACRTSAGLFNTACRHFSRNSSLGFWWASESFRRCSGVSFRPVSAREMLTEVSGLRFLPFRLMPFACSHSNLCR